jgi:ABC-2 type transport system ATP-binding protein
MKQTHCRLTLRFNQSLPKSPAFGGTLTSVGSGNEWTYVCKGDAVQLKRQAESLGAEVVEESSVSLDDIFVSRVSFNQPVAP